MKRLATISITFYPSSEGDAFALEGAVRALASALHDNHQDKTKPPFPQQLWFPAVGAEIDIQIEEFKA